MPGFEIIDKKEKKAILDLFSTGNQVLFAHGFEKIRKNFHVREFENQIAKFSKSKYCLAVSSGTAAIKISLLALGVKAGDEVITQAFNFIATAEAIHDVGAKTVICDIDDTLNMCPNDLRKKINRKTKAIIPVHMLGVSAKMTEIIKIAKKNRIPVCEDVCEAFGGKYKSKSLGMLGDIGVFSFDFGKTITTGEGGAIITNNKNLFNYSMSYHDHGHENKFPSRGNDSAKFFGFNYRMTEMQAVVGKTQLSKINLILKKNEERYKVLEKILKAKFRIREIPKKSKQNFEAFIFSAENKSKNKIISLLSKLGFGTKNLPDAIKWHCSYYWKRGLDYKQIKNSYKTKIKLSSRIAIPILLKKSINDYYNLANKILKI